MKIFDVFCGEGIQGNPCAVIMLTGWPPEHELAQSARRLKVPVTSFIVSHGLEHHIRWFSAAGEINLCGHGSLAAGAALLEQSRQKRVTLSSRYGPVTIVKNANRYQLELPSWKRNNCSIAKEQLGLTIEPLDIFSTRDLVVVLESEGAVKDYNPNFKKIRKLNQFHAVILTAMSSTNSYVLRYFAPI
ncbi:PhzF family phenazine biosynthesis protein [Pleionea litopenaei]|uniref:PhzF family phenazine biosynthesis protein n=1 Tax=Pleionea litopenaei TaxID=3070815 RepID=A0AA51RQ48_9GAMM|nr:PhzF family phenazine biosynthesis protein [Pleionea sp. HL-JVS1]WMS85561.1 PhzF family phenazine biosynthesis protein [Pleionea sp. HL-JVS1]